jgi:hypothetical protein
MVFKVDDDMIFSTGDCFVSKPRPDSVYTLKACYERGKHTLGKPKSCRTAYNVVGKPNAFCAQYLLGRPQAKTALEMECGVYVLQRADGGFYVGKSGNIQERLRQHADGSGAVCAKGKCRRVAPLTPPCEDLEAWERAEVLARMLKHGVGKVRGWMYTTPELSEAQTEHAFEQVCEKYDLCRRCGRRGHFAGGCQAQAASRPSWACV